MPRYCDFFLFFVLGNKKLYYICIPLGALSSVGSEHLPYKQGVTGSNPVGPTSFRKSARYRADFLFSGECQTCLNIRREIKNIRLRSMPEFTNCRSGFPMDIQSSSCRRKNILRRKSPGIFYLQEWFPDGSPNRMR